MGFLLPAMTEEKLANQQHVVQNERRESEGRPYSAFWLTFNENFYPKGHPYDHSVIGIHEDLESATLDDVKDFFRTYYTPNNATLSIAGDFDPAEAKAWVEKYFSPIPPGPPVEEVSTWIPDMPSDKRIRAEDDVQLARIYFAWHSPPYYAEGDADLDLAANIMGSGPSSRLYRRMVHEEKIAQDVSFWQGSQQVSSALHAVVTLRPGVSAADAERVFDEECARFAAEGPTKEELTRAKTVFEAGFVKGVQTIGAWGGKNDRLNRYNHYVGTPDYFQQDYDRYMTRTADTVREQFAKWTGRGRLIYTISPLGSLVAADAGAVDYSTLPEGEPTPPLVAPEIHRKTLPNGLRLAVLTHDELPLVRLNLAFRSGTAADPEGLGGLADLAGDMLMEGTARRDKFAYSDALDAIGTDLGLWTNTDFATMWMLGLRSNLDETLDLMAEAILEPAFPEKEFEDQKTRRLTDIRRQKDSPRTISQIATRRILFGDGHPYSRIGSGVVESMEAITLEDVKEYAAANFTPGNATLVAVGDITLEDLEKLVNRHLGKWTGPAPEQGAVPAPPARSGRVVYLIDKPGDSQSTISIGHPGIARNHPDWEKVFVANRVFGGQFSSRLNLNLREDKGYTYGARSSTMEHAGPSAYTMSARVQTEVTAEALVEFMKEYEGVAGGTPITQDELEFAKNSVVMGYPREFETIGQLANAVTEQVVYGLPDDNFARYPERIAAVDLKTVNGTAASHFDPENLAIIVVGDREVIEDSIRALNLGPIRYADANGVVLEERELSSR
ncbi:MAG: insulinase family protein, partial [Gemmatimonadetes bacterium]|nr:insulinase family protein [Gemmatimonadota bacterium]